MIYYKIFQLIIGLLLIASVGCDEKEAVKPPEIEKILLEEQEIVINRTYTEKEVYQKNEIVKLSGIKISNRSGENIKIDSIWIEVGKAIYNSRFVLKSIPIDGYKSIDAGEELNIPDNDVLINMEDLNERSYLVTLHMDISSVDTNKILEQHIEEYLTFFRIANSEERLTYQINDEIKDGLPIYKLSGGLSAEYAVQKSIASFNSGISHSWQNIHPLLSTPNFLERSINKTVDLYNSAIGSTTKINTVVISTGITPISSIAHSLGAPILPLHFLVGSHTVKEIQTILDYANEKSGIPAYASYGHDYSLSTTKGVAWIKMLDLPAAYQKFLNDHQVENVVFLGATSAGGGEKAARQVKNGKGDHEAGSIYLMYFAGDEAESYLSQVISDFDKNNLGPLVQIEDWESGIIQKQVDNMTFAMKANTAASNVVLVTSSVSDINLWNLASFSTLKLFEKNNISPKGISLNPYLAGHPFYESYFGIVPFTYFNHSGFPLSWHTDRIEGMLTDAFNIYFPEQNIKEMYVVANTGTRYDFIAALEDDGFVSVTSLPNEDVWNLNDGIETPSEFRAAHFLSKTPADELRIWRENLSFLTIQDLKDIQSKFPQILVVDQ
ncbi:hypothetical protein E9993_07095 [Labilibacter sediminis]|nr:hypothetical protein E9993_07095 [Labilibacter sediminis]